MNGVPVGLGQRKMHPVWGLEKAGLAIRGPRPFGHPSLARSLVLTHSKFDRLVCLFVCLCHCHSCCYCSGSGSCCCGGLNADLATRRRMRMRKRKRHMQAKTAASTNMSRMKAITGVISPRGYSLLWVLILLP